MSTSGRLIAAAVVVALLVVAYDASTDSPSNSGGGDALYPLAGDEFDLNYPAAGGSEVSSDPRADYPTVGETSTEDSSSLAGTWILTDVFPETIADPGTDPISLTFTADGSMTGIVDCATYEATFEIDGALIAWEGFEQHTEGCEDDTNGVAYLEALNLTEAVEKGDGWLILRSRELELVYEQGE